MGPGSILTTQSHSWLFPCHKAKDLPLPFWTQPALHGRPRRQPHFIDEKREAMAGASLQARVSSPWADTAGRAGPSLFSYQQSDSRTVTSWREPGPPLRGVRIASGLRHFLSQHTHATPPVCKSQRRGAEQPGERGLRKSLTAGLDPDCYPAPGSGGDKIRAAVP